MHTFPVGKSSPPLPIVVLNHLMSNLYFFVVQIEPEKLPFSMLFIIQKLS